VLGWIDRRAATTHSSSTGVAVAGTRLWYKYVVVASWLWYNGIPEKQKRGGVRAVHQNSRTSGDGLPARSHTYLCTEQSLAPCLHLEGIAPRQWQWQ